MAAGRLTRKPFVIEVVFVIFFSFILPGVSPTQAVHYAWDQGHDTTDWDEPPPPGLCQDGICRGDTGDCGRMSSPVYLATGHFVWTDIDLSLRGSPVLQVARTFNSNDPRYGLFGNGWSFSHDRTLIMVVDSGSDTVSGTSQSIRYLMRLSNGKRYAFLENPDGTVEAPSGVFRTVEPQTNGFLKLVFNDDSYEIYREDGKLVQATDRDGNALLYTYANSLLTRVEDGNGRYLDFTYNSSGRVEQVSDHTGRSWNYEYDTDGNLVRVKNPLGDIYHYEYQAYSPSGDGDTYFLLSKIIDETGRVVVQVTYDGERVRTYADGENIFTLSYDSINSMVTKRDILSSEERIKYNADGLYVERTDPLNRTVSYERDENGLITEFTDEIGNQAAWIYDKRGRILEVSDERGKVLLEYENNHPWPVKITTPSGRMLSTAYDERGNPTAITDVAGHTTALTWDLKGNVLSLTDPLGNTGTVLYNQINLPQMVTDPLGRTLSYEYDPRGNITAITNAAGETVRYEYDTLDRLIRMTNAAGEQIEYVYDAASRVVAVRAPNGAQVLFEYDQYGRVSKRIDYDGASYTYVYRPDNLVSTIIDPKNTNIRFAYNRAKEVVSVNVGGIATSYEYTERGQLKRVTNGNSTLEMSYDNLGRLIQEILGSSTIRYEYNNEDELIKRSLLVGSNTLEEAYQYDERGLLKIIDSPSGIFSFTYDAASRRTGLSLPNNSTVEYTYDGANQLTAIEHTGPYTATYQYQYDPAGRLLVVNIDGQQTTYAYDPVGRLLHAVSQQTLSYDYDSLGNLVGDGRIFDDASKLTEDNESTYSYDAAGNLVERRSKRDGSRTVYTWNARNQLVRVETFIAAVSTNPSSRITYAYGPLNRRLMRATHDGISEHIEHYVYTGPERLASIASDGSIASYYTLGNSIDEPLAFKVGDLSYYYHADIQGSIRAISDQQQTIANYQYTPYGTMSVQGDDHGNPLRFLGREDEGNGLYYFRARYYSADLQRFITKDPIGLAGSLNPYEFLASSPVNLIDPYGLETFGIGIEEPRSDAVDHGVLNPTVDTGHTFAYTRDDSGDITNIISFGPGAQIGIGNAKDFRDGNLAGNPDWPLHGSAYTFEWDISEEDYKRGNKWWEQFKKSPPNYTPTIQCTSVATQAAKKYGVTLPSGTSPIEVRISIPGVSFPPYKNNLPNPYGLLQDLKKIQEPKKVPASSFSAEPRKFKEK